MHFTLFFTLATLASASILLPPQKRQDNDVGRLIPPIPPCAGCTLTCAAVFAACAFVCAIPGDPFCEACVVTEDAALGDTCLACLRTCFFPANLLNNPAPLSEERRASIQAALDKHNLPLQAKPPGEPGTVALPGFAPTTEWTNLRNPGEATA